MDTQSTHSGGRQRGWRLIGKVQERRKGSQRVKEGIGESH